MVSLPNYPSLPKNEVPLLFHEIPLEKDGIPVQTPLNTYTNPKQYASTYKRANNVWTLNQITRVEQMEEISMQGKRIYLTRRLSKKFDGVPRLLRDNDSTSNVSKEVRSTRKKALQGALMAATREEMRILSVFFSLPFQSFIPSRNSKRHHHCKDVGHNFPTAPWLRIKQTRRYTDSMRHTRANCPVSR